MLRTVTKYEKVKPDVNWSGKLTYCKACGDIICSIGDLSDECDCGNSTITKLHGSGAVGNCIVQVKKGDILRGTVGNEIIENCPIDEFGLKFKKLFISKNFPRNVTITVVPKEVKIEEPVIEQKPITEEERILVAEPIFVEDYDDKFDAREKSKSKSNRNKTKNTKK